LLFPSFIEGGYQIFSEIGEEMIKISHLMEDTYTYVYWDDLDKTIHDYGCNHYNVKKVLTQINDVLEEVANKLGKDSILIITADHGLIDTKTIYLNNFSEITKYLTKLPSLEQRYMSFYVNDKEGFAKEFNKYFASYFDLYTKDEFLEKGFLGNDYEKAKEFLGDFIVIAKDKYAIDARQISRTIKSKHAGITSLEMMVPLIIYHK